jgi:two-component system alkaline phosphatase synthesis response regulator PhoP
VSSISRKVLVVDDDSDFVEAVSSYLEAHGYVVHKAYDGHEGLKVAKIQHPDLIIIDVMMTERTEGFFTVQEIRKTRGLEKVPIFVVSSLYTTVADFRVSPDSGWLEHDEFIPKPVDLQLLLERIRLRIGDRRDDRGSADKKRPKT